MDLVNCQKNHPRYFNRFPLITAILLTTTVSLTASAKVNNPMVIPSSKGATIQEGVHNGDVAFHLRARAEHAYEPILEPGRAYTLATKLTYNTADMCDFLGLIEFDHVTSYFNDKHNAGQGTTPGQEPNYPIIPDPEGTAMTQAFFQFHGWNQTYVKVGRQAFSFDDERFVGTSDFRQTPQTFDAVSIHSSMIPDVKWFYAYVFQYNSPWQGNKRALQGQRKHDTHLINVSWNVLPCLDLTGYAYFVHDDIILTDSSDTFGARLSGKTRIERDFILKYHLEAAVQNDAHNNPFDYTAHYYLVDLHAIYQNFGINLGYASLEGDDTQQGKYLRTPLASSHMHQGLTDIFLYRPNSNGVKDYYVGLWADLIFGLKAKAAYHYYDKYSGDGSIGHEWDFGIKRVFLNQFEIGLDYAKLSAKPTSDYGTGHKVWLWASAKI
jgi:hypothetical protein